MYSNKDNIREEYWKGRYDYKKQREEITHIEWMQRQKDRIVQRAAQKQERDEEVKKEISQLDHPYQRELDCCESLTGYLHALKVRTGQTVDNEVAARKA